MEPCCDGRAFPRPRRRLPIFRDVWRTAAVTASPAKCYKTRAINHATKAAQPPLPTTGTAYCENLTWPPGNIRFRLARIAGSWKCNSKIRSRIRTRLSSNSARASARMNGGCVHGAGVGPVGPCGMLSDWSTEPERFVCFAAARADERNYFDAARRFPGGSDCN